MEKNPDELDLAEIRQAIKRLTTHSDYQAGEIALLKGSVKRLRQAIIDIHLQAIREIEEDAEARDREYRTEREARDREYRIARARSVGNAD